MRGDLDRFLFEPDDIVLALGQDGLVANVAKYLDGQPVIGSNPSRPPTSRSRSSCARPGRAASPARASPPACSTRRTTSLGVDTLRAFMLETREHTALGVRDARGVLLLERRRLGA